MVRRGVGHHPLDNRLAGVAAARSIGMHMGSDKRSAHPSPWRIALISRRRPRTRLR